MAESDTVNRQSGVCDQCGDEYVDLRKHWSLSSSCSAPEGKGTYAVVECSNCGEEHEKERYELRDNEESYCSRQCRNEGMKTGGHVECAWCGSDVYKPDCHTDSAGNYSIDNHFCDKECEGKFKSENWCGEKHPNWSGGTETVECEVCGDEYEVKPSEVAKTRFCSLDCQCKNMVQARPDQSGSNNPAWQGGSGGVEAVRRKIAKEDWRTIAERVRKDKCEICGLSEVPQSLAVHHIVPIVAGGTHGGWNLMSLCHSCHRKAEQFTKQFTEPHLLKYERGDT